MTSYLIDVNVWLAIAWDLHQQHGRAWRWYAALPRDPERVELLFCRLTMLGFLRLLTNRSVMGDSTATLRQAFEIYDRWGEDPRVILAPEPCGAEHCLREAAAPFGRQRSTKAIADCYLAGFAEAAGAHLVTFDKGLAGIARLRTTSVVLLESD